MRNRSFIPQSQHTIPLIILGLVIIALNIVMVGLGFYITQVSFPGRVLELQFTAYQGTTVIQNVSMIWWQIAVALGITVINSLILSALWWKQLFHKVIRFVCTYWLFGITIVTLIGILYYLILVIQVNS